MDLSGSPENFCCSSADQGTAKPQLVLCSGVMSMPLLPSGVVQLPSEPSLGQLAPPSASRVALGLMVMSPSGPVSCNDPSSAQPCQRWRTWNRTPLWRRRCSQARNKGAAFISLGNTRPEVPTKVSMPRVCTQVRRASGGNRSRLGCSKACSAP